METIRIVDIPGKDKGENDMVVKEELKKAVGTAFFDAGIESIESLRPLITNYLEVIQPKALRDLLKFSGKNLYRRR